jgi:hypothetical protein
VTAAPHQETGKVYILVAHTSGCCGGDRGFAWGNPSRDPKACNNCGHSGHIAAVCMVDMPQWRKDEIKGSLSQASIAEIGEIDDELVQEASHFKKSHLACLAPQLCGANSTATKHAQFI